MRIVSRSRLGSDAQLIGGLTNSQQAVPAAVQGLQVRSCRRGADAGDPALRSSLLARSAQSADVPVEEVDSTLPR
jgi:hypothetical protein